VEQRQGAVEGLEMKASWKGRRVFLTGHTGFKGAWLALWLQQLGAEVTGYALEPPTQPNLFEEADVARGMASLHGDVRDRDKVEKALRASRAEVVIHMAAQSLVRRSYADPAGTYATNVMGTVNVLDAVRSAGGVRAVVIVTSDKCYENEERPHGYSEGDRLGGFDPYSNSKACAELVTAAYRNSFFHPEKYREHGTAVASARAGNVIGGGDWAEDRLVPDVMRALLAKKKAVMRNPNATRPWQHVIEPLGGYLLLASRLLEDGAKDSGAWNFGPEEDEVRPVSWVVEQIHKLWGAGEWVADAGNQVHEAGKLQLDASKARKELGWQPRMRLDEGLRATVEWYKALQAGKDMRALTLEQIERSMRSTAVV
jgi:CDP-glucose 4,6-dehydratase